VAGRGEAIETVIIPIYQLLRMNWDYIAGLFDGDGSVAISSSIPSTAPHIKRKRYRSLKMIISITSINRDFLSKLCEWFEEQGMRATISSAKTRSPKVQIAAHASVRKFVDNVLPRVHLKKRTLEIMGEALDLRAQLKQDESKTISGNLHLFNGFREELHSLAMKGRKTLTLW